MPLFIIFIHDPQRVLTAQKFRDEKMKRKKTI